MFLCWEFHKAFCQFSPPSLLKSNYFVAIGTELTTKRLDILESTLYGRLIVQQNTFN